MKFVLKLTHKDLESGEVAEILRSLANRIDGHPHFSPGHDQALHNMDGKEIGFASVLERDQKVTL